MIVLFSPLNTCIGLRTALVVFLYTAREILVLWAPNAVLLTTGSSGSTFKPTCTCIVGRLVRVSLRMGLHLAVGALARRAVLRESHVTASL